MNRDNSNEDNLNTNDNPSKTENICMRLRTLMYCLFALAVIRICTSQLLWMITDLLSAAIVYCTYISKGKIMALFCFINGIMSALYAIIFSIAALNDQGKNNNGAKDNSANNKADTFKTDFTDNSMGRTPTFSLYPALIVIAMIWALVVYALIAYYSYEGFKHFHDPIGSFTNNQNEDGRLIRKDRDSNNYGAVNYGNNGYGLSSTNSNNGGNRLVPFSGRGTVLGA